MSQLSTNAVLYELPIAAVQRAQRQQGPMLKRCAHAGRGSGEG